MIITLNAVIPYIGIVFCIYALIVRKYRTIKFDTVNIFYISIAAFGVLAYIDMGVGYQWSLPYSTLFVRLCALITVILASTIIRRYTILKRKLEELNHDNDL